MRIVVTFNANYKPLALSSKVYIRVIKIGEHGYYIPNRIGLSAKLISPYSIKRKLSDLTYELELPENSRLYPVISVIYLE